MADEGGHRRKRSLFGGKAHHDRSKSLTDILPQVWAGGSPQKSQYVPVDIPPPSVLVLDSLDSVGTDRSLKNVKAKKRGRTWLFASMFVCCGICWCAFMAVLCSGAVTTGALVATLSGNSASASSGDGGASSSTAVDIRLPSNMTWALMAWGYDFGGNDTVSSATEMVIVDIDKTSEIAAYKAQNLMVVCYVSVGSTEPFRADYTARKAAWDALSVHKMGNWDEYWLDISRLDELKDLISPRMDDAVENGCDALEPDNLDCFINSLCYDNLSGAPYTYAERKAFQVAYNSWLAENAHAKGLKIALKNALSIVQELVDSFDFAINESCFLYNECSLLQPFTDQDKLIAHIEYSLPANSSVYCDNPYPGTILKTKYCNGTSGTCNTGTELFSC